MGRRQRQQAGRPAATVRSDNGCAGGALTDRLPERFDVYGFGVRVAFVRHTDILHLVKDAN